MRMREVQSHNPPSHQQIMENHQPTSPEENKKNILGNKKFLEAIKKLEAIKEVQTTESLSSIEQLQSIQEQTDKPFNDENLIRAIKNLRVHEPTLNSTQIWDKLVFTWPGGLDEAVVEACLMEHFDYFLEDTNVIRKFKETELAKAKCECVSCPKLVTLEDIKYLYEGPKEVDPLATISVPLLRVMLNTPSTILSFLPQNTPKELAETTFSSLSPAQRVYALFYAEWDAWIGPPLDQIYPKVEFDVNIEPKLFQDFAHCKHKMTYWHPKAGHSFEEHAQRALQSPCSNWRSNNRWLNFVLTRTQDRDTIMMVNSILVGLFGLKCRHMGHGFVEWQCWHCNWFHSIRVEDQAVEDEEVQGKKVLYVIENEGGTEIKYAESRGSTFMYFFPPLKLDVGTSSPSLQLRLEMSKKGAAEYMAMLHDGTSPSGNRCMTSRQEAYV